MKSLLIVLPLMAVALSSCEKARQAVEAAREKIEGSKDPDAPVAPGGEISTKLAGQVDTAAEGVRFRRDLAFPTELKVRLIERVTFNGARVMSTSELGKQVSVLDGTWERIGSIKRDKGELAISIEKAGKVVDVEEVAKKAGAAEKDEPQSPQSDSNVVGARVEFKLGPNGWKRPASSGPVDFRNMMLEQALRPELPSLLATNGVTPRTQWFSPSKRWIGGDKIVLTGSSIALLFPGEGNSGSITLTYEASEALEGHPCGRFAVAGDLSEKGAVDIDGTKRNSETTIKSGKVWCSLIYPMVLREEYQMVVTSEEGSGNGPKSKIQGGIDTVVSRAWESGED
ncbi:hypothetical protein [Luteolibacter marinus]|uniref:hypothetical protein n=1 Tax=Luteolibacter marinus TaxID=2776705 RepID=UPI001867260F|nr:hypothetical protein [Luteolibacter marinus]